MVLYYVHTHVLTILAWSDVAVCLYVVQVLISPKQASAVDKHFAFSASNPYAGVETKIMVLALDLRTQASMTCRYST